MAAGSFIFGISLLSLGCLSSAIGMILMKVSADREQTLPLWKRKFWILGFIFLVVNATVIDIITYGILTLAVIAPFAGLTIVCSSVIATSGLLYIGESMTMRDWLATATIVAGITVVSVFGPKSSENPTLEELPQHYTAPPFVAFACLLVFINLAYFMVPVVFPSAPDNSRSRLLHCALAAAGCGALSQMFLKMVAVSVQATFAGDNQFVHFQTYFQLLGLLMFAPLQLVLLNGALARGDVTMVVPVYQSFLILLTISAGGTFFLEFNHMSAVDLVMFAVGSSISMVGTVALTATKKESEDKQKLTTTEEVPMEAMQPEVEPDKAALLKRDAILSELEKEEILFLPSSDRTGGEGEGEGEDRREDLSLQDGCPSLAIE